MIFYGLIDLFEINKTVINSEFIVKILLRTIIRYNVYRHFGINDISVFCIQKLCKIYIYRKKDKLIHIFYTMHFRILFVIFGLHDVIFKNIKILTLNRKILFYLFKPCYLIKN